MAKILTRVYHRDEAGLIEIGSSGGLTEDQHLDDRTVHGFRPVTQGVSSLAGWPDPAVEWFGYDRDSACAIGFPRG